MMFLRSVVLLLIFSAPATAQSLEVGGFDIKLGESFETVARRLSAVYELQNVSGAVAYVTGGKVWLIQRRDADRTIIGGVDVKDGIVVGINRDWSGDPYQLSRAFASYLREAQRAGGKVCVTSPDFVLDEAGGQVSQIMSYTTTCGRYRIVHGVVWSQLVPHETLSIRVW